MLVTSQHMHFLLFPHCFQKISSQGRVVKCLKAKGGTDCGYKSMHQFLTFQRPFLKQALFLRVCCSSLLKTLEKEDIAGNEHFLLFPTVFSTCLTNFPPFKKNHEIVICKLCRFGRVCNTCGLGNDFSANIVSFLKQCARTE